MLRAESTKNWFNPEAFDRRFGFGAIALAAGSAKVIGESVVWVACSG
jgi:hypothetical protein